jgi:lysophospholipase L1-like esterase
VHFNNQTLRQIVHVSIGGSRVRVVLNNTFGTAPLSVGGANIGLRDSEAAIAAQSSRPLTFSGLSSFTIPAGAIFVSDPVELTVPALADVVVDLYLPGSTDGPSPLTMHNTGLATNYVSSSGNYAGASSFPSSTTTQSWFLLARVEVMAPEAVGALVAFGDSITDGTRSTANTNNRWPDQLARRLNQPSSPVKLGVLNAGIAGNRVLTDAVFNVGVNALARFERDVISQTGVTHVIVMEGINDIGTARQNPTPAAADLIAAHRQLIERAHARGLRILGATLTPFEGAAYFTQEGEAKRQAMNSWIRTGNAYDGVIDFDMVTRDPNQPTRFKAEYDSGDHLHPNDAGYLAMGNAVDLTLLQPASRSTRTASR